MPSVHPLVASASEVLREDHLDEILFEAERRLRAHAYVESVLLHLNLVDIGL